MEIIRTLGAVRTAVSKAQKQGLLIGLVPTMGALHEGHASLIRRCRSECGFAVVSIFVNPTQFGPTEDLAKYPRPFEQDCQLCQREGVDVVFAPETQEMYPDKNLCWVNVETISEHLCGASRPGHFQGVCTVVAKLFHICSPDIAYFGQKDAQQLAILQRMTDDLDFPVQIRSCPIVREPDGLAMSSRNRYLNPEERKQALCLFQSLRHAEQLVRGGQTDAQTITEEVRRIIQMQPLAQIDYISIVDKDFLQPISMIDQPVLLAIAVRIGPARLIDNIFIDPNSKSF